MSSMISGITEWFGMSSPTKNAAAPLLAAPEHVLLAAGVAKAAKSGKAAKVAKAPKAAKAAVVVKSPKAVKAVKAAKTPEDVGKLNEVALTIARAHNAKKKREWRAAQKKAEGGFTAVTISTCTVPAVVWHM